MERPVPEVGDLLWEPSQAFREASNLSHFMAWLAREDGRQFEDYEALWRWSVDDVAGFWEALWRYFGLESSTPYAEGLSSPQMPGAHWFPGARVNYARYALAQGSGDQIAIHADSEAGTLRRITWDELQASVFRVATRLREMGVEPGDRVAAYMPNVPETVVAFLACAAIGAVWSSCSPDFGSPSVIDRFQQIEPKILVATDGYHFGGRPFDRSKEVREMVAALPSLERVVHLPGLPGAEPPVADALPWSELDSGEAPADFAFEDTDFSDPLWVLYSSGTTGPPKPFVHGHGGILLEALKFMRFHVNLKPDSTLFFYTTTGWMMWNFVVDGLATGAAIVLYDGNPLAPEPDVLFRLAADTGATAFGASPAYINFQMRQGAAPEADHDLSRLGAVLMSGSPVMPEHMQWCLDHLGADTWVASASGGTDIASGFVGGCPLRPVHGGEIQARCLGVDVHACNNAGEPVIDEVGEMVIRQSMPSMPLYFWGDSDYQRYRDAYFDVFPGVWRHGDYFKVNGHGGCFIMGRSDATLNRHGIRIGPAEIYSVVEGLAEVADCIVVNLDLPGGNAFMPMFVVLHEGFNLDEELDKHIREALRSAYSPRHVPDRIVQAPAVPATLTGKKMEVPLRKVLLGSSVDNVASRDAMTDPNALDFYADYAQHQADYRVGTG